MLFLLLLIAFHVYVDLFHAIHKCLQWTVLYCFGNIGFASLECLIKLLVIVMLSSLVGFGKSCANCLISDVDFSSRFRAEWLNSKDATEKPANRNPKGHGFSFGFRGGAPSPPADGKLEGRFMFLTA